MVVCGKTCAGFRDFLLRGNVVDIAVGIVIGAAFKDVVDGLVADLITPLIAVAGGMPDFSEASFTIRGSEFKYGHFVNTIISFIVLSAVVYFLVVIPTQKLIASMMAKKSDGNRPCESCLEAVPRDAKVCKFCCRDLPPPPPIPVEEQRKGMFGMVADKMKKKKGKDEVMNEEKKEPTPPPPPPPADEQTP